MNYDEELAFAKELAYEAGKITRHYFRADDIGTGWKEDATPVTLADIQVNKLVIQKVKQAFPADGVLGEEQSANLKAERIWVCDPVDGTMSFSHGLPISTFSLALVIGGSPVLGVVYDPFMDRLFWASVGNGAFMNDSGIHVSQNADLQNTIINIEGIPKGSKTVRQFTDNFVRDLSNLGTNVTSLKSVILSSVLVAAGQFTASMFNVPKPEDGAAIKVIIEEAGGKVTDLFGNEQRYDRPTMGFLASNGLVHQQLVELIKSHML